MFDKTTFKIIVNVMKANEIINAFCNNTLIEKSANKVFPNVYIGCFEADIIELTKSGYAVEYEVKITRADFRNDAKKQKKQDVYAIQPPKSKYEILQEGKRVNRFYYIVPEGLIAENEIPEFAGLIYARKGVIGYYSIEKGFYDKENIFFRTIKTAPILAKEKLSDSKLQKCFESTYYRFHKYRKQCS
jgi:hypothetical protein